MAKAATSLKREILDAANRHPRIAYIASFAVGVYRGNSGQRVRVGPTGFPDLFGYTRDGRAVFIEIKSETDHFRGRPEQQSFLATARVFGCIAGYVRSVEDFEELMG